MALHRLVTASDVLIEMLLNYYRPSQNGAIEISQTLIRQSNGIGNRFKAEINMVYQPLSEMNWQSQIMQVQISATKWYSVLFPFKSNSLA